MEISAAGRILSLNKSAIRKAASRFIENEDTKEVVGAIMKANG